MFDHWNLWFGIYLKFGAWNLEFISSHLCLKRKNASISFLSKKGLSSAGRADAP